MTEKTLNKIKALNSIIEYMNYNSLQVLCDKETPLFISIGIPQIENLKKIISSYAENNGDTIDDIHDDVKNTYNTVIKEYKNIRGWE